MPTFFVTFDLLYEGVLRDMETPEKVASFLKSPDAAQALEHDFGIRATGVRLIDISELKPNINHLSVSTGPAVEKHAVWKLAETGFAGGVAEHEAEVDGEPVPSVTGGPLTFDQLQAYLHSHQDLPEPVVLVDLKGRTSLTQVEKQALFEGLVRMLSLIPEARPLKLAKEGGDD